jgi:hypothetical protein
MVKCSALFEVRTKFLNIIQTNFRFKGLFIYAHGNLGRVGPLKFPLYMKLVKRRARDPDHSPH